MQTAFFIGVGMMVLGAAAVAVWLLLRFGLPALLWTAIILIAYVIGGIIAGS